jgi:hypothetical protein
MPVAAFAEAEMSKKSKTTKKARQHPVLIHVPSHTSSSAPSVEERLRTIEREVIGIAAMLHSVSEHEDEAAHLIGVMPSDLADAALQSAQQVLHELHFLKALPAAVLNTHAPDDDRPQGRIGGGQ